MNQIFTVHSLKVFMAFLWRDLYVSSRNISSYIINYVFIYPVVFSLETAYLQANTYFDAVNPQLCTMMFTGYILLIVMIFTYQRNIEILFDLENKRFIDYQITIMHPFLVLFERILFTALFTFVVSLPFYPVAKLILPEYIDVRHTSWPKVIVLLFLGSLCASAYHLLAACVVKKSSNIDSIWSRANIILIDFGGLWIPWLTIYTWSPLVGSLVYLNPLIYLSEGMKGAILGSNEFIGFKICVSMLCFFIVLFTGLCWIAFKRRIDCI